jgi:hypothetical protein
MNDYRIVPVLCTLFENQKLQLIRGKVINDKNFIIWQEITFIKKHCLS